MAGREDEAFEAYLQIREIRLDLAGIDWRGIFRSGGWPAVRRVRLDHFPKNTYNQVKTWFLILSGRRNDALNELEILEKSDSSGVMLDLKYGIHDPLRQEPRFQSLMKRVGYPESMWRAR